MLNFKRIKSKIMFFSIKNNIFFQKYIPWILVFLLALFIGKNVAQGRIEHIVALFLLFFFLIVLIKPLIGLIISIPLILYFSYIDFGPISPWNYILFFLVFIAILFLFYRGKIKINNFSQKILLIFILYIFLTVVINWVQGIPAKDFLYNGVVLFSTLLVGFCTMFFIKNEKQLKAFLYFLVGFMSVSAFVGIMQFIGIEFFWRLREFWGVYPPAIAPDILARVRIPGLALFSIPLSYQLASVVPLIFAILIIKKRKQSRFFLLFAFIICFSALLATQARSAIIGGVFALGVITFYNYKGFRINKRILLPLGIASFVIILFLFAAPGRFAVQRFFFQDQDIATIARIPAFIISGRVFLDHPLGTGRDIDRYVEYLPEFEELLYKYVNRFAPHRLAELPAFLKARGMISPHNHFINILLYYGIFGFLLLFLFYYYIFKGLFVLLRNNKDKPFIKAVALGLIASFIAYIINSLFHNMGPFLIDPFNWYFVGITLFLLNHYGKFSKSSFRYELAKN